MFLVGAMVVVALGVAGLVIYLLANRPDDGKKEAPSNPQAAASGDDAPDSDPGEDPDRPDDKPRDWPTVFSEYKDSVVVVRVAKEAGSGFFVDEKGLLCTNIRILQSAFEDEEGIEVELPRGEGEEAEEEPTIFTSIVPVYLDPASDIALLAIEDEGAGPFKAVRLEADDSYRTAEEIASITSPAGAEGRVLQSTLTRGTVANRERRMFGMDLIQVDLALNKGSTGGPVFNREGEVIGIACAEFSNLERQNFAIPVKFIRQAIQAYAEAPTAEEDTDAFRKGVEEYWTALTADSVDGLTPHFPGYLHERYHAPFNEVVEYCRKMVLARHQRGRDRTEFVEWIYRRSTEAGLLCERIFETDRKEKGDFSPEEVRQYYVDLARKRWEKRSGTAFEVETVEIHGALARAKVKISMKEEVAADGSKSRRKVSEWQAWIRDRGKWKTHVLPLDAGDLGYFY